MDFCTFNKIVSQFSAIRMKVNIEDSQQVQFLWNLRSRRPLYGRYAWKMWLFKVNCSWPVHFSGGRELQGTGSWNINGAKLSGLSFFYGMNFSGQKYGPFPRNVKVRNGTIFEGRSSNAYWYCDISKFWIEAHIDSEKSSKAFVNAKWTRNTKNKDEQPHETILKI